MAFRYLSVCAGLCAASVAWAPLNWQCAGYSEIEPFPRAVLEQRHGAVAVDWDHRHAAGQNFTPLFGDFTKIEAHHVGPIDLLVGGTPCQSFSVAGKRLGLDDPRGNLTLEFLALAGRLRPRWLVWENVPGVLSDDKGRTLGTILAAMGQLGYRWAYRVLDAQYVRVAGFRRAVPQRRRRLFLVGYLGDGARAQTVLFERESLRGNPAPRRETGKGVAATIAASTGGCSGKDAQDGRLIVAPVACTIPAGGNQTGGSRQPGMGAETAGTMLVAHTLRGEGMDASEDGSGRGTSIAFQERAVSENPDVWPAGKGWQEDHAYTLEARSQVQAVAFPERLSGTQCASASDLSPSLGAANPMAVAFQDRSQVQAVAFVQNTRDEVRLFGGDGLTVGALGAEPGMKQQAFLATSWAVRRLTPRECERLQGLPDDFTQVTYRGKPAADSPRYKAIGNSMAVNVMRWIGMRIDRVDQISAHGRG
jgi:DNA (cytosine-5)-methyltransferase 1